MSTKSFTAQYDPEYNYNGSKDEPHDNSKCIMLYKTKSFNHWWTGKPVTKTSKSASFYVFAHDDGAYSMLADLHNDNNRIQSDAASDAYCAQALFKSTYYQNKMEDLPESKSKEWLATEIARTSSLVCKPVDPRVSKELQTSMIQAAENVVKKPVYVIRGSEAFQNSQGYNNLALNRT